MDYNDEIAEIAKRYGTRKFSIEDINFIREVQGKKPYDVKQMLIFVSILKKKYRIKTSYLRGSVSTKTYYQILPNNKET